MDSDTSSIVIEFLEDEAILPFVEEYPVSETVLRKELRKRMRKMGELYPEEIKDSAVKERFSRMVRGYPRLIQIITMDMIVSRYVIDQTINVEDFASELQKELSENFDEGEKLIISKENSLKLAHYLLDEDLEDEWHDSAFSYLIRSGVVQEDVEIIQGSPLYIHVTEPIFMETF